MFDNPVKNYLSAIESLITCTEIVTKYKWAFFLMVLLCNFLQEKKKRKLEQTPENCTKNNNACIGDDTIYVPKLKPSSQTLD